MMTLRDTRLVLLLACQVSACSSDRAPGHAPAPSPAASLDAARAPLPEAGRREEAWVSNSGEPTISVIDHESQAVVDTIRLGVSGDGGSLRGIPHGIAVTRAGDVAYAATEDTGEVIAINTTTRTILWRLHAGNNFQLGTLTADDHYLFLPDLSAGRVVVIDTAQRKVDVEIPMVDGTNAALSGLHNMYTSADGTEIFATAIFSQKVAKIGAITRQIERLYDIDGQPRPAVLTRALSTMYLQLSALNGFVAIDLATGKETRRIAIAEDGTRPPGWDNWTFAHGLYLSKDESELWCDSVVAGKVYAYSVPALDQLATIAVGVMPRWFAATEDETTLYVTNTTPAADHGTVSVIDRQARKVVATLDVGKAPKDVHMVAVPR